MHNALKLAICTLALFCASCAAYAQPSDSGGEVHPIIVLFAVVQNPYNREAELSGQPYELYFDLIGSTKDGEWTGESNGWHDGEWGENFFADVSYPDEFTYDLYSLRGYLGKATCAARPAQWPPWIFHAIPDPEIPWESLGFAVGIGCDWNPMPRIPRFDDTSLDIYRDAVWTAMLAAEEEATRLWGDLSTGFHDILEMNYRVDEALRIDLDGDGTEEVIVTGTVGDDPEHNPHFGHTIVLIKGTDVIPLFIWDLLSVINHGIEPTSPNVIGILDADGDGTMEILVQSTCCASFWYTYLTVDGLEIQRRSYMPTWELW